MLKQVKCYLHWRKVNTRINIFLWSQPPLNYRPHPKERESTVFSLAVHTSTGGRGVYIPIPGQDGGGGGGYPLSQVQGKGSSPSPVQDGGGGGVPISQARMGGGGGYFHPADGGYPIPGQAGGTPLLAGWGYPSPHPSLRSGWREGGTSTGTA